MDLEADERRAPTEQWFPFDTRRRRMSVLAGGNLLVKGAPESVLPRCGKVGDAEAALQAMAGRWHPQV